MTAGPAAWGAPHGGLRGAWLGLADFLGAMVRRTRPGLFLLWVLALSVLAALATTGIATPAIMAAPMSAKLGRAAEYVVLGLAIVIGILAADEAVDRGRPRGPSYALAIVVSAVLGAVLGWEVRLAMGLHFLPPGSSHVFNPLHPLLHRLDVALIGILVGGLTTFVHVNRRTALAARQRQYESEQARARARRRTLESELQALQARVEPMFLFDTLARIRRLYRADAEAAGAMLEDLIVYLRAALPHLRESASTVAQEARLARAWLDIVGRSMPGRRFELDVEAAAGEARLPALVILPLIQQAVGAGAESLRLWLRVRIESGRLAIEVSTSGAGFAAGIAGQPLLEQLQERLRAIYGAEASFALGASAGEAAGGIARVELPLERAEAEAEAAAVPA